MPTPQKPTDQYTANGWFLELPTLVSPHFETLEGLSKKTGRVELVDAGTNVKYKFSSQIKDYGEITLTRTDDGSSDDTALLALVEASIESGVKYSGVLVMRHHGQEVFRIAFDGLRFETHEHPSYNVNGEDKLTRRYVCTVDEWLQV